jgi:hypothetical protein
MVEVVKATTKPRTRAFKLLNEGRRPVSRTHIPPDFSDEAAFEEGALIRARLLADPSPEERDRLEIAEREHALKYWGF